MSKTKTILIEKEEKVSAILSKRPLKNNDAKAIRLEVLVHLKESMKKNDSLGELLAQ